MLSHVVVAVSVHTSVHTLALVSIVGVGVSVLHAIDHANNLDISTLDDAFKGERAAFKAFWAHKDCTEPLGPVSGALSTGEGYNASAKIAPRFWRASLSSSSSLSLLSRRLCRHHRGCRRRRRVTMQVPRLSRASGVPLGKALRRGYCRQCRTR